MLSKRNVSYIFPIFILFLYFLFMVSSCSTVPPVDIGNTIEPDNQEKIKEAIEIVPEIVALYRPVFYPDTAILTEDFETALPNLEPPQSISLYKRIEVIEIDLPGDMNLLSPELYLKPEKNPELDVSLHEEKTEIIKETPATAQSIIEPEEKKKEIKDTKKKKEKEKKIQEYKETIVPNVNEVFSHRGENIEISFTHNGWIFAGYIDDNDAKGITYISKDTTYWESLFTFKTMQTGSFDLEFVLQDHGSGSQEKEIVRVHVLDDTEFIPDNYADFITTNNLAEGFFLQGDYQHALDEYLKIYDEASPLLNTKIAELYEKLGQNESAVPFWEKNFIKDDEYSIDAAKKLLSYSIDTRENEKLILYLNYLLNKGNEYPIPEIVEIVNILKNKNDCKNAVSILNKYLSLYKNPEMLDALYFLLAGLYESNSGIRNLKQSKYYYEKIISDYPASSYIRPARKRLKYLDRHFFYIH